MPARYRALFSQWRNVTATDTYGNTAGGSTGVNADLNTMNGYLRATTQLGQYDRARSGEHDRARAVARTVAVRLG